ncbi:MAG: uroporphyrinogen decarboxylase family protein [Candidatus Bathyarchaeia archaeon]
MKSRDRVLKAIWHEEPDRVPMIEPYGIHAPTADLVLGRRCVATHPLRTVQLRAEGRIPELRRAIVNDSYELVKKLGYDGGGIAFLPTERDERPKMLGPNKWAEGSSVFVLAEKTGIPFEVDSEIRRRGLTAFEEYVKGLESEGRDERTSELARRLQDYEENLGRLWKGLGVLVYSGINGTAMPTLTTSWLPLYLTWFYVKPVLVKRYLQQMTLRNVEWIELTADFGAELFYAGGDIASNQGPFISPAHYREFQLPMIRAVSEAAHKRNAYLFTSSDGNLWPIAEDFLVNSEVDGYMEIQVTAGMCLSKLKEKLGDRLCLNGSVDAQHTLVHGSAGQVKAETRKVIETLSPGGGHILSTSNSVHPGVKPENFFAMLETASEYGQYAHGREDA